MIVVSDTGPLNYLILIGAVDVLRRLFGAVLIPQAVADELSSPFAPEPVRLWVAHLPEWCELRSAPLPDPELASLESGEQAAIGLADVVSADRLLVDDWEARLAAERRKITVTGTLGILALASKGGLLEFEDAVARLLLTNFYVSPELLARIRLLLQSP